MSCKYPEFDILLKSFDKKVLKSKISKRGPNAEKGDQKGTTFQENSPLGTNPQKGDRLVNTVNNDCFRLIVSTL